LDVEANKALVRRFYEEVWARGNVGFAEEVFADDYVRHDLRPTTAAPGGAGQALIAERFRRAFPDLKWRIDLVVGERDLVAARWTASGTNSGAWGDEVPSGKHVTFSGVNIFRFGESGKVVEIWNHRDDLGLREQLGTPVFAGAPTSGQGDDDEGSVVS
jgi:predicted ester cyclase